MFQLKFRVFNCESVRMCKLIKIQNSLNFVNLSPQNFRM